MCAARVHRWVDRTCSVAVSSAVLGVNLYCLDLHAESVVVPIITAACCSTAAISKVAKRIINQARPQGAPKLSPGMPSNHATALSFLTVAACVGIHQHNDAASSRTTMLAQAGLMCYSIYATALRVHCGHHTTPQVVVGYIFGSTSAALCVAANYAGYHGECVGGRVDELSPPIKMTLLVASGMIGVMAFSSIFRGSPLWKTWRGSSLTSPKK